MNSLSGTLEGRKQALMDRDKTAASDKLREAFFHFVAGCDKLQLYSNIDMLYDFEEHTIKQDCLQKDEMRNSESIVNFAVALFEGNGSSQMEEINKFKKVEDDSSPDEEKGIYDGDGLVALACAALMIADVKNFLQ